VNNPLPIILLGAAGVFAWLAGRSGSGSGQAVSEPTKIEKIGSDVIMPGDDKTIEALQKFAQTAAALGGTMSFLSPDFEFQLSTPMQPVTTPTNNGTIETNARAAGFPAGEYQLIPFSINPYTGAVVAMDPYRFSYKYNYLTSADRGTEAFTLLVNSRTIFLDGGEGPSFDSIKRIHPDSTEIAVKTSGQYRFLENEGKFTI
jgi:hypothetical protein